MDISINFTGKYAVVVTFSWDSQVSVMLFDTQEDAWEFIKEDVLREYDIDTRENEYISEYSILEDEMRAILTTHGTTDDYVTEWRIGDVFEKD